jgi:hypothetical protein
MTLSEWIAEARKEILAFMTSQAVSSAEHAAASYFSIKGRLDALQALEDADIDFHKSAFQKEHK